MSATDKISGKEIVIGVIVLVVIAAVMFKILACSSSRTQDRSDRSSR